MITRDANNNEHGLPKIHVRLETAVQEINLKIVSECRLEGISDVLCQKFEQQIAVQLSKRKIRELGPARDFIKKEGEKFIHDHRTFLESRNPSDALSLLRNPGPQGTSNGKKEAFMPTVHIPGSEGKIAVLLARQSAGLPLWHPEDATYDVERNNLLKHLLGEQSRSEEKA